MKIGRHYKGFVWNLLDPLGFFDFKNGSDPLSVLKNVGGKYLGTGLTDADVEANEFSAQEAQKQRDFDAQQAELAYERQREFYQDFQSPAAQVQQYQEAGLNPALMYGRGATPASAISAPQASGSGAPSSVKPSTGDIGQLVSLLANIGFRKKEVDAEVKLKNAQSEYFSSMATGTENENSVFFERYDFWKQMQTKTMGEIDSRIFLNAAEEAFKRQGISESQARVTLLEYQSAVAASEAKYADQLNESLLKLRESAMELNEAQAEFARSQSEESKQRLNEARQSWGSRWLTLQENCRKASADAGMSENEAAAFWDDKRLNELFVLSEIYDNYQRQFKAGPISIDNDNWQRQLFDRAGLPSLYTPQ